jgi:NADH:ubiquinone reductase (H+-translocating)
MKRPAEVVIVGGGFGGVTAAQHLRDPDLVHVTIIDRKNHHCFQPLLYQVATAALSPADIAWPIRAIFRKQANVRVVMADVDAVDTAAHTLRAGALTFPYDFLILATGATHSYFGHDEWAPYAPGLKHIEDATEIRRRLLLAFERAEVAADDNERQRLLTFVIVGGGPTGVEMAGAIAEVARQTLRSDFREIDPRTSRIILVEAGPKILPSFPDTLAAYARRQLEAMGVEIRTLTAVTDCDQSGVAFAGGRIAASTVIWAAGVVASPAATWLGAEHDRAGRVLVTPQLSVPAHADVFVIGDAAAVDDPAGKPVPGIAPAAKQMGRYVADRIVGRLKGGTVGDKAFVYRHAGDLATIGRKAAIVRLGRLRLRGFIGWLFWSVVHIYFLIDTRHRFMVAFTWLWSYLTFQRGARLITGTDSARE